MAEPREARNGRVRLVSRKLAPNRSRSEQLVVLVDGEPLEAVKRISIDYDYGQEIPVLKLELIGVEIDLEAEPDWVVKVRRRFPDLEDFPDPFED